ncbi:hypothetical protein ACQP0U_31225 [Micromonospora sp. CA-269861]|uniref:hypothetical protein n=1 Tax=Micromonospora sp. CA-269861 TaxID=3239968 RepID=UPI003D9019FB
MTVDDELSRALSELSRTLTPQPDPYGRARARYRRSRQRRLGGLVLALVVSVGSTAFAIASPGRTTQPLPADPTESIAPVLAWSDRLLQSPPRGAVAGDSSYVRQLSEQLLAAQRRGEFSRLTVPVSGVKILFADDVDGRRVALAAFVRSQPDPVTGWPSAAVWLVADEGASAQELASTAAVRGVSDALEPYESLAVDGPESAHVAIAPTGCVFLSSPLPDGDTFRWAPEPTGSYLVRTAKTKRPEWWRVDCGAVTRQLMPGPGSLASKPITDAQLATAMSHVRGSVEQQRARELVYEWAQSEGYRLTALPSVVWGGHVAGLPTDPASESPSAGEPSAEGAQVTVLTAPTVGGGWVGEVSIAPDQPRSDGVLSTGASFTTMTDPTDPSGVLAVSVDDGAAGDEGQQVLLVVTPAAATTVRVLRDGQEVARSAANGSGTVMRVPRPTDGLVLEALDGSGRTIAGGQVAEQGAQRTPETDTWNQE